MGERVIKDKFNIHETYRKMNITNPYRYASEGGGGSTINLDSYPNAKGAYSLREVYSYYSGALFTLRRSDSTEQTFYAVNGEFPTDDVLNFAQGGDCFGVTWNDQSGNGKNATAAGDIYLVKSGVLVTENGNPSWEYTLNSIWNVPNSTSYYAFMHHTAKFTFVGTTRIDKSDTSAAKYLCDNRSNAGSGKGILNWYDNRSGNNILYLYVAGGGSYPVQISTTTLLTTTGQYIFYHTFDVGNANANDRHNGLANTSALPKNTKTSATDTDPATIDLRINMTQELVIWDSFIGTDVQTEINNFYGAY
jgi:hypothetical protein